MNARNSTFFDRVMDWSLTRGLSPLASYLATTLAVAGIALIRARFVTDQVPWLLFVPAILAIALVFGEGAGVYASVLSAAFAALSIGRSWHPYWLSGEQWIATGLFVATTFLVVRLAGVARSSLRRTIMLNHRLAEREAFLQSVLAASTDCIKVLGLDGSLQFMSDGGMRVMEIDDFDRVRGCPWPDFWQGDGHGEARAAIEQAKAGREADFLAQADTYLGNPRWWSVSVSPIRDMGGKVASILSVSRDHTALVESRDRQELLNRELAHRLKNVLALTQSIASQTFRQATSIEEANTAFASRLVALAHAADVLTGVSWQVATLRQVVEAGLTAVSGCRDRIVVDGPQIELNPQVAMAMTLALHELATNAAKYGALSNEIGTVSLRWEIAQGEIEADQRFRMTWREAGGPPVSPPTRKGFGSRMIERSLGAYFRGVTRVAYEPAGVVFTMDAPLAEAGRTVEG